MYLPSDTQIMAQNTADAVALTQCEEGKVAGIRQMSAANRIQLFNTLVSPQQVAEAIGMGTALDTAKLQAQSRDARASATLGTGGLIDTAVGPSWQEIIAGAPEVVSLNRGGGGCLTPKYKSEVHVEPQPGMPHRAPGIEDGPYGVMYYRGADSTVEGSYPTRTGLTGYAPPWSDAYVLPDGGQQSSGVMGVADWLMAHPWLALAIAGAAGVALSKRGKR